MNIILADDHPTPPKYFEIQTETKMMANNPNICDAMNPAKKFLTFPKAMPPSRAAESYSIIKGVVSRFAGRKKCFINSRE